MTQRIDELLAQFDKESVGVASRDSLRALRDRWLGRKAGIVTEVSKTMGSLAPEERSAFGKALNQLKQRVESTLQSIDESLTTIERDEAIARETVDVTTPGRRPRRARAGRTIGRRPPPEPRFSMGLGETLRRASTPSTSGASACFRTAAAYL